MTFFRNLTHLASTWVRTHPTQLWAKQTVPDQLPVAFIASVAYRVNEWPSLQDEFKTAGNYRVLSNMYVEAVTWDWIRESLGGSMSQTAALLRHLETLGALQIVKVQYQRSDKTLSDCIDEQVKAHNTQAVRN